MIVSLEQVMKAAIEPALALLPRALDSVPARLLLVAIALQESGLAARYQRLAGGGRGAARGFWQFERGTVKTRGGISGVMLHPASAELLRGVCRAQGCAFDATAIWERVEIDDVLAAGVARLMLLTHPAPLPAIGATQAAWDYYEGVWRPGKPRRESWDGYYARAIEVAT